MPSAAPTPSAIDPPAADRDAAGKALLDRQMAMLARLAEIGMEIAEAAGRRACALAEGGGTDANATDPGLSFARAARAVRLTIALQSRLAKDEAAQDQARTLARTAEAARRRDCIHRRVEQVIATERTCEDEIEQLSSNAWEQLTDADEDDLLDLPMHELVARICEDLGLAPHLYAPTFAPPAFAPQTPEPQTPAPPTPAPPDGVESPPAPRQAGFPPDPPPPPSSSAPSSSSLALRRGSRGPPQGRLLS